MALFLRCRVFVVPLEEEFADHVVGVDLAVEIRLDRAGRRHGCLQRDGIQRDDPVHRLAAVGDPGPHHVLAGDPVVLVQVRPREAVLGVLLGVIGPFGDRVPRHARVAGEEVAAHRTLVDDLHFALVELQQSCAQGRTATGVELAGVVEHDQVRRRLILPEQSREVGQDVFVDLQAPLDAVDLVLGLVHETAQDRRDVRGHLLQGRIRPGQIVGDLLDLRLDVLQRGDVDRAVLEGRLFVTGQSGVHIVGHVGALEDLQGRVQERIGAGEVGAEVGDHVQRRHGQRGDAALSCPGVGAGRFDGCGSACGVTGRDLVGHRRERRVRLSGVPSEHPQAHDEPGSQQPDQDKDPGSGALPAGAAVGHRTRFAHDTPIRSLVTTVGASR